MRNQKPIAIALVLGFMLVGIMSPVGSLSAPNGGQQSSNSNGETFFGQAYFGVMMGGELYLNNTFPFQTYAQTSHILALPTVKSWLATNGYVSQLLRPYLSLYPSQGNPYDFAQTEVTENGTTYYVYEYLVMNSSNGPVIGIWVSVGTQTVAKIYEYSYNEHAADQVYNKEGAGQEAYQPCCSNSPPGAIYYSSVFSDLSTPSSCNPTYCWELSNWIGASNYNWVGGCSSHCYFFQAVLRYWGGNLGSSTVCNGGSYSTDCAVFEYVLNSGTFSYNWPGVGSWAKGDPVNYEWEYYPYANCQGGYGPDQFVTEYVTDTKTGASTQLTQCMPVITYTQFIEERFTLNGVLAQDPKFGTHSLAACLFNSAYSCTPLSSAQSTYVLYMVNNGGSTLVWSSALTNGASSSSWSDHWQSSSYP